MDQEKFVPAGKVVTLADVTPYARRRCGVCGGTGVMRRRLPGATRWEESACGCATRAFALAHPGVVVDRSTGEGYWPTEQEAPQAAGVDLRGAIPPPVVPTPQPEENAQPRASYAAKREARLQAEVARAQAELDEVRGLVDAEAQEHVEALHAHEDLLLTQTSELAGLHHREHQTADRIRRLEEELDVLREVRRQIAEVEAPPLSEAIDAGWAVRTELEQAVKDAGARYRPRQRKARERVEQLNKRLARLRAGKGEAE